MNWTDFLPQANAIVNRHRAEAPAGYDPQNTGVGLAVGAVAVSAGMGAYAASQQAGAQEDANKANAENAQNTNAMNYRQFQESRGSKGNAVLPLYLKDGQGQSFESSLGKGAMEIYDATGALMGSPEERLKANQSIVDRFSSAQAGAASTANGIFDGSLVNEALGNHDELAATRNEGAATRKAAGLEGLMEQLNEISAMQAGKGYQGDSLGNRMLKTNVRRQVFQSAAADQAVVNEQNATDRYGIKQQGILTRLGNLNLPKNMAQQEIGMKNLASDSIMDEEARRQQLFNFFRIGTGNFQYSPMPQVQPVASTGQIVGQGLSSVAGGIGNYYAQKNLITQMNQTGGTGATGLKASWTGPDPVSISRNPNAAMWG